MGWLIVDFAAARMCLIIRCFCEKFRGLLSVGGICKSQSIDPRPPWCDRGMCEQLIIVVPLYILNIVFGYGVTC